MKQTARDFLLGRRATRLRWLGLAPAAIAHLFLLDAAMHGGLAGAIPHVVVYVLSITYVFRPTVALWVPLFAVCVWYGATTAVHMHSVVPTQRLPTALLGVLPIALMVLAWPLKPKSK